MTSLKKARSKIPSNPGVINKEMRNRVAVLTQPTSPGRNNTRTAQQRALEQTRKTNERMQKEKTKLDAFQHVTLQRAVLRSSAAASLEPEAIKATEFEVALRDAVQNQKAFAALMRGVPLNAQGV